MSKLKRFVYYHLPPLLFMVLIFSLSSIPNLKFRDDEVEFVRRRFVHMAEYAILWFLIYRGILQEKWWQEFGKNIGKVVLSIVLTLLYALTDEYHQSLVPTRTGKIVDWMFDSIGASIGFSGLMIVTAIENGLSKNKKTPIWPLVWGVFLLTGSVLLVIFV